MTDAVRGIKGKTGAAPCRTQMLFIDFQNMEGMTAAVHEHCMHIAFAAGYNWNTWEGTKYVPHVFVSLIHEILQFHTAEC